MRLKTGLSGPMLKWDRTSLHFLLDKNIKHQLTSEKPSDVSFQMLNIHNNIQCNNRTSLYELETILHKYFICYYAVHKVSHQ